MTRQQILGLCALIAYILLMLGLWAWKLHCFFFFHVWDTHRELSDVCLRCGAIRFK